MAPMRSYTTPRGSCLLSQESMALLLLVFFASACELAMGAQYTVGDTGWGLGNDFAGWASQFKFYVGDDLYFSYPAGQHSVLLVTEEDYKDCNIERPFTSDDGMGDMLITLVDAQTYYFICGVPGHCEQGLRLKIEVENETPSTSKEPPPPDATVHDPPPPDVETHEPPPPDVETHEPPPPVVEEHDPPPPHAPEEERSPPPPEAKADDSKSSPPYYSQYNTFHRNSSPQLSIGTLTYVATMFLSLACTLSLV
ncbi:hypothetical protein GOP47_0002758 [Adiantum capillus-veneris]|uniref:Phytocyanin domain-containing protein n=1 Tax=Adiantum capillus-veneris TaxID=13818 RepID=A0A9D4VBJ0_ADICA|nr:hypothetical protein GOP47_0002758 [Adiantum capillus-veneris]